MKEGDIHVRVWDLPTRLFHWLLAICVTFSLLTGFFAVFGAATITWHERSGYLAVGLVAFRVIWGFIGGTYARFSSFIRGLATVKAYLRSLAQPEAESPLGHNPLGGWSVIAMLIAVGVQAISGLFLSDPDYGYEAPLAKLVSRAVSDRMNAIHTTVVWVVLALVVLHLAALLYYALVKKKNLVPAMFTGFRRVAFAKPEDPSRGGNLLLGLAVAAAVGYGVWWLVTRS